MRASCRGDGVREVGWMLTLYPVSDTVLVVAAKLRAIIASKQTDAPELSFPPSRSSRATEQERAQVLAS